MIDVWGEVEICQIYILRSKITNLRSAKNRMRNAIARNEIYPITMSEFGFGVGFVDLS